MSIRIPSPRSEWYELDDPVTVFMATGVEICNRYPDRHTIDENQHFTYLNTDFSGEGAWVDGIPGWCVVIVHNEDGSVIGVFDIGLQKAVDLGWRV